MTEYINHKTKAQLEFEKWKDYMIDKGSDYICSVPSCRKIWFPCVDDINRKRPSTYYKLCSACRLKSFTMARKYKALKGNNYNALYPNKDGEQNDISI